MDQEQVLETPIQETQEETTTQPDQKEVVENEWIAPTQEEYNKAIQSASSKAKYALLQELGIKSVDEFKTKANTYEEAIKETESLKKANSDYANQINGLKEEMLISQLGVSEDYKEDFLTLAKAKVTESKDFTTAAKEVLDKNPNWRNLQEPIKMGTEKSEQKQIHNSLSKKYSWIK